MSIQLLKPHESALRSTTPSPGNPLWAQGVLIEIEATGHLKIDTSEFGILLCEWLHSESNSGIELEIGDRLLINLYSPDQPAVAIGRIGPYSARLNDRKLSAQVTIEATESLALKCGKSTIELHADGKLLVKGEDVLLRAKGTQKIRAGTVSIN